MEALYLLVPLSLGIVALAVWIFFRMADSGQFDDPVGPAHQILLDDDRPRPHAANTDTATDTDAGPRTAPLPSPGAAEPVPQPAGSAGQGANAGIASIGDQPSRPATAAKSSPGGIASSNPRPSSG